MQRTKIENLNEKDFVTSLIVSDKCCQVLVPYIKLKYFNNEYTRIVTEWIINYYKEFKCSPKQDIISLYRVHESEIADEATKDLIFNYIKKINESNPINNEDYLLDNSRNFLDFKALELYTENLQACLDVKNMDKAREIQNGFREVSVAETNEVSLLSLKDSDIIKKSLETSQEELFTVAENLNKVIGKIHRHDLIAILAPPKKGKTWMLQYLALSALKQRLNVVYVSMEMTREETVQRMWKTLLGSKSGIIEEGLYEGARFVEDISEEGKYRSELVDYQVKAQDVKDVSEYQKILRAENQYSGDLRIIAYPRFGASVQQICNRVEELAREGFVADVLVIDYADITTPIGGGSELRNQIDAIWKFLGGFAMKFHCAVITASQTNRSGVSASKVGAETIGEDFRKLAHVTSMVSLEQTPKMRKEHIMRVRNLAVRNGDVEETCVFPQCLGLGQFVFGKPILGKDFIYNDDSSENEEEE